jgi:hypothetical protein
MSPRGGGARVDLHGAEAEGRGYPEEGAHRGEHVHRVADGAAHALPEQGPQQGPRRQGHAVPEMLVRERGTHHDVQSPGLKAPVEERPPHRLARRLPCPWRHLGGLQVVVQRLGHTPEDQTGAHARAEQHGEPGRAAELGACVVGPEADVRRRPEQEPQREPHHEGGGHHVEPAKLHDDAVLQGGEGALGHVGEGRAEGHERQRDQAGAGEDGQVDGAPRPLPRAPVLRRHPPNVRSPRGRRTGPSTRSPLRGCHSSGGVQAVCAMSPSSRPSQIRSCLNMNSMPSRLERSTR